MSLPSDTPAPTPEELEQAQTRMIDTLFPVGKSLSQIRAEAEAEERKKNSPAPAAGGTPPPATPPAAPVTPPAETPPVVPPATPPATPPPVQPAVVPPPPTLEVEPPPPPLPTPAPIVPPAELPVSEADKRMLETMERMGKENPQYKNLAAETMQFWQQEQAYIKDWEARHPGQKFDEDAEEHNSFYESEPDFEEDDFTLTREKIIEERAEQRATEKITRSTDKERKKAEFAQKFESSEPEIRAAASEKVHIMISQALPDIAEQMKNGDKIVLSEELETKLKTEMPEIHEILLDNAERVNALVIELNRLARFGDEYKPNPNFRVKLGNGDTIHPHAEIMDTVSALEKRMLEKPPQETLRDGKRLISSDMYGEFMDKLVKSKATPAEKQSKAHQFQSQYYCLTPADYEAEILRNSVARTQKEIGRVKKHMKPVVPASGQQPQTGGTPPPQTPAPAPAPAASSRPPSLTPSSDIQATPGVNTAGVKKAEDEVVERMWPVAK